MLEKNGCKGTSKRELNRTCWNPQDASELYDVSRWGKGYFSVSEKGHVHVHPEKDPLLRSIDLKQLIDTLILRLDLAANSDFASAEILSTGWANYTMPSGLPFMNTNTTASTAAFIRLK